MDSLFGLESEVHRAPAWQRPSEHVASIWTSHRSQDCRLLWRPRQWHQEMRKRRQPLPPPSAPESPFFLTLGTPAQQQCPPLNSTLAQRTKEEGARTLCENKAVAIIQGMQEGKPALIPKECEEILIAIVLDRPLKEAQRLVENPERFFNEILEALETHRNHPVLTQLLLDIASASAASTTSQPAGQQVTPPMQFQ